MFYYPCLPQNILSAQRDVATGNVGCHTPNSSEQQSNLGKYFKILYIYAKLVVLEEPHLLLIKGTVKEQIKKLQYILQNCV